MDVCAGGRRRGWGKEGRVEEEGEGGRRGRVDEGGESGGKVG